MMEIDAFLADSVEAVNGKIYALGAGWDMVGVAQFPTRHPRIGLGILIRVPYDATNRQHKVEITLHDADGGIHPLAQNPSNPEKKLNNLSASFNIGRPPHLLPGDSQQVPLAMNLDGMVFEAPGSFSFVISIDGVEVKRLPLRMVEKKRPTPSV